MATIPEPRVIKVAVNTAAHATDYNSGDMVGVGVLTFDNLTNTGRGVIVTDIVITDTAELTGAMELWIFDADPSSGSTLTDNAAADVDGAQASKLRRVIPIATTDWVNCGGFTAANPSFDKFAVFPGGQGDTIYAVLVARATRNQTAANNITVSIGVDAT